MAEQTEMKNSGAEGSPFFTPLARLYDYSQDPIDMGKMVHERQTRARPPQEKCSIEVPEERACAGLL